MKNIINYSTDYSKEIKLVIIALVLLVPILVTNQGYHSDNTVNVQTENEGSNVQNIGKTLVKEVALTIPGISNSMEVQYFSVDQSTDIDVEVDGNGNPIIISGNEAYQQLSFQIIDTLPIGTALQSITLKNAPYSVIENLNLNILGKISKSESNAKLNLKVSQTINYTDSTLGNPIGITSGPNSYIANNTLTTYANTEYSVVTILDSKNVKIYNNSFTDISATSGSVTAIKVYAVLGLGDSDGTQIYNNTFSQFSGSTTAIGINVTGLASQVHDNILIANNTISQFSADDGVFGITGKYTNNIDIIGNSFQNVSSDFGVIEGITTSYSSSIAIENNSLTFLESDGHITLIKTRTSSSVSTIRYNNLKWITSVNGNITGIDVNSGLFTINYNNIEQFTASYGSFDFSGTKHIFAIKVEGVSSSNIRFNFINQLVSKSKVYAIKLHNYSSSKAINNTIIDLNGKSTFGIVLTGTTNSAFEASNNTITKLISTATETFGISLENSNLAKVIGNSISNLEGHSKLNGITVGTTSTVTIDKNNIFDLTTDSPVYKLTVIHVFDTTGVTLSSNSISNINSEQTFVQGILVENSPSPTINDNSIVDMKTTFSSAFGLILDNSGTALIDGNTLNNITSADISAFSYSKPMEIEVDLSGGYGIFIYQSNSITISQNTIDQTDFWLNSDETAVDLTFSNNQVDGTPLTFVSMTHPADFTFEQGTLTKNITWVANDVNADTFQIFVDAVEVVSGTWWDGVSIVYGVADIQTLSLGQHEVQLVLKDVNNHKITDIVKVTVVELEAPTFDPISNKTMVNGTIGNSISWIANDLNPATYKIYIHNGNAGTIEVESATWTSGFPISYSIDNLTLVSDLNISSAGNITLYKFTISVSDTSGNSANSSIFVTVLESSALSITPLQSSTKAVTYGSKNETLSWSLTSFSSGTYTILVDGEVKQSGNWDPEQPVTFSLTNLPLGEHDIMLVAQNEFDTLANQSVQITVFIPNTNIEETSTFIPSFSAVPDGGIFNLIRIDTNSLFLIILFSALIIGSLGFIYIMRQRAYKSSVYVNKTERVEKFIELGEAYLKIGDTMKAINSFKRALNGSKNIEDKRLEAESLKSLGKAGLSLQNIDDQTLEATLEYLQEALEQSITLQEKHLQVECYSLLGECHSHYGNVDETIENYDKGIKLAKQTDDELSEIEILQKLGTYQEVLDERKKALKTYQSALEIAKSVKEFKLQYNLEYAIANVLRDLGNYDEAYKSYKSAKKATAKYNDITSEAKIIGDLGRAYYLAKKESQAIKAFNESMTLAHRVGDEQIEALQRHNLAIIDFEHDEFQACLEKTEESLKVLNLAVFHDLKGDALIGLHEIPKAISSYKKALKISQKSNDKLQEFDSALKIFEIYNRIGSDKDISKARDDLEQVNEDFDLFNKKISSRRNSKHRVRTQELDKKIMFLINENVVREGKNEQNTQLDDEASSNDKGDN